MSAKFRVRRPAVLGERLEHRAGPRRWAGTGWTASDTGPVLLGQDLVSLLGRRACGRSRSTCALARLPEPVQHQIDGDVGDRRSFVAVAAAGRSSRLSPSGARMTQTRSVHPASTLAWDTSGRRTSASASCGIRSGAARIRHTQLASPSTHAVLQPDNTHHAVAAQPMVAPGDRWLGGLDHGGDPAKRHPGRRTAGRAESSRPAGQSRGKVCAMAGLYEDFSLSVISGLIAVSTP